MAILTNTFDAFGLDIGDRSLKAVQLKKNGSAVTLASRGSAQVPPGVFNAGMIAKPQDFTAAVSAAVAACGPKKIKTTYVHACLPETQTFIKVLEFKEAGPAELGAMVREELPKHVPLDIDAAYVDWKIISRSGTGGGVRVLAGAIPKETSDAYTRALRAAGLVPLSLQVEAQAIIRNLVDPDAEDSGPLAIMDIGATRSSFILYDQGSIQFTVSIPVAGESATAAIARALSLPLEEAENAKRAMGLDPKKGGGGVRKVLLPMMTELANAIYRNRVFYGEHFAHARPVTNIMLCGGGAFMPGLPETLREIMPDTVITYGNPGLRVKGGAEAGLTLSDTTAAGLALTDLL